MSPGADLRRGPNEGVAGAPRVGEPRRRIVVATIIDTHNYGTVLQAAATRSVLEAYGAPAFVDYCRPEFTRAGWAAERMAAEGPAPLKAARLAAALPARLRSERVFRGFVERHLGLCDAAPFLAGGDFDVDAVYVVGSDQTWNSVYNRGISPLYFLESVPDGCRKVALSASFGRESLDVWERDETARLLRRFDAVSVRERSSLEILDSLGVRGAALKDPVLLCDPSLWDRMADPAPAAGEGYVLVYMLNRDGRLLEHARAVARERGLGVGAVTFNPLRPAPRGVRAACLPTPEEWLALFRDASYVVTDSFHGACFSLIFERPFTAFDPPRFSVRISDLLADFGLSGREVPVGAPAEGVRVGHGLPIDWGSVRSLRARFRAEGGAFLDGCLG